MNGPYPFLKLSILCLVAVAFPRPLPSSAWCDSVNALARCSKPDAVPLPALFDTPLTDQPKLLPSGPTRRITGQARAVDANAPRLSRTILFAMAIHRS